MNRFRQAILQAPTDPAKQEDDVKSDKSDREPNLSPEPRAGVVIIGAGFAGLEVARELGKAGVETTIIDRRNHHLFQPLLYQVATAALSAPDIAEPIRRILRRYRSVKVLLGDVDQIDTAARKVHLIEVLPIPWTGSGAF